MADAEGAAEVLRAGKEGDCDRRGEANEQEPNSTRESTASVDNGDAINLSALKLGADVGSDGKARSNAVYRGTGNADGSESERQGEEEEDVFEEALNEEEFAKKLLQQAEEEKSNGNTLYKSNDMEGALSCYEKALDLINSSSDAASSELKSTLHSNSAACFLKLEKFQDVVRECTLSIEIKDSIKARMRRASAYEKLDRYEDALLDLKKVCEMDPRNRDAAFESMRVQDLVNKRREEMMGKLKDLGNSLLGKFGLSLDNFKTVKDPNTGGYSISFQQ